MTTWNPRHLPYPLLAPWNDDYGDNTFGAIVPQAVLNNGAEISFTIKYNLTSQYIRELIAEGKATYVALVTCSKTSSRNAYVTNQNQDEDVHVLNASDYSEEFRLFPYVVAMQRINGFTSDEHAEEFKQFKPDGFDIAPASILAVGQGSRIVLEAGSPYSVIDLVNNPQIENGMFKVDLEEQRIKIHVSPNDKNQIEALRDKGRHSAEMSTLFPAIYLHAVTEALRNLSEHPDAGWAFTIKQSLEERNIVADDEELKNNALTYAQQLLAKPVGKLLTAFVNKEED